MVSADFPERIILSRKGFDQTAGGCASPIIDQHLFSIPIPENPRHRSSTRYEDLRTQAGIPLPRRLLSQRREVSLTGSVHLDPDIRHGLRSATSASRCDPARLFFGQDGGPQSHLHDFGVCEGDLFLFFGWFREAVTEGKDLRFVRAAPNLHAIWGWLQIGRVHVLEFGAECPKCLEDARHHPHVHSTDRTKNCVYEASPRLSFDRRYAGAGIFNPFSDALRLTAPGETRRSYWTLPKFFGESNITHVRCGEWESRGETIFGRSPGRGQEFVFDTGPVKQEAARWVKALFRNAPQDCQ